MSLLFNGIAVSERENKEKGTLRFDPNKESGNEVVITDELGRQAYLSTTSYVDNKIEEINPPTRIGVFTDDRPSKILQDDEWSNNIKTGEYLVASTHDEAKDYVIDWNGFGVGNYLTNTTYYGIKRINTRWVTEENCKGNELDFSELLPISKKHSGLTQNAVEIEFGDYLITSTKHNESNNEKFIVDVDTAKIPGAISNSLSKNFLPLSGGTMGGNIKLATSSDLTSSCRISAIYSGYKRESGCYMDANGVTLYADGGAGAPSLNLNGKSFSSIGSNLTVSGGTLNVDTSKFLTLKDGGRVLGDTTFEYLSATTLNVSNVLTVGTADVTANTNTVITYDSVKAKSFYEHSDKNLKSNIRDIQDIDKAGLIKFVEFDFINDESDKKKYGVIAQDIESCGLDNLVIEDDSGIKSVDYISLLCLKMEQMDKEIKSLKDEISKLKEK